VCFIQGVGRLDRPFRRDVVRPIELMVGGVSTERDMLGRAMMLFYVN
jgi:hypothetical protein